MLSYSDNNPTKALYDNLSSGEIADVLDNMDVTNNSYDYSHFVSVLGHSGYSRILYNSANFNWEMSEKVLEFLMQQDFPRYCCRCASVSSGSC